MGFFDKLKQGLGKTKSSFDEKINDMFSSFRKVDEDFLEELEEALIMSDIGMETSVKIVDKLRKTIKKENLKDEEDVKAALRKEMQEILDEVEHDLHLETKPSVILVVGVNGVGKTTSIGKIANRLRKDGKKVVVAAADTFRAAAVEQLEIWSQRSGAEIVKREEGRDPASVVFDAIQKTKEIGADVLIVDTAGRLHNKVGLMNELKKIKDVMKKLNQILVGYYHYYGITDNSEVLSKLKFRVTQILFKCLNRRSQKRSYNWEQFNDLLKDFPLARPKIYVSIYGDR